MAQNVISNIDDILPLIGEIGPFQCLLDFIFFLINIPLAYNMMIMMFLTLPSDWVCKSNSTTCIWNGTFSGNDMRRCQLPKTEWSYVENKDFSLITSFDIDCGKEWALEIATSIFFAAWACGSLFFGWISDNYGRKKILFISFPVIVISGFISAFTNSLIVFSCCRFIAGLFFAGTVFQPFVIISELVGNRYRPFAGLFFYSSNPLAWCFMALLSYYINNWRMLWIWCTAPYLLMVGFYKFTPESVQWQFVHGKVDELKSTAQRIAKWNKKELPVELEFEIPSIKETIKRSTPLDLFQNRSVALLTIAQSIMWFCAAMGYIGNLLSVSNLDGSIYTNFVMINLGSVFSFFLGPYFCMKFGRKRTVIVCLFLAAIICIINGFIPNKMITLRIVFAIVGKNFADMGYNSCYTWSCELYPTMIRSEGLGFLAICARLGSAASPWVANYLKVYKDWLPFVVMGAFLLVGSMIGFYLPETKEQIELGNMKTTNSDQNDRAVSEHSNQAYSEDS